MPDYSSDLFFLFFFRLQSSHWSVHFLQFSILRRAPGPSPPMANFTPKGTPFHFLLFQGNIQNRTCPKGPPFGFFSELCDFFRKFFFRKFFSFRKQNGMFVNKSRRVPPFTFFGTMRLLLKEFFFQKFQFFSKKSVLRFLSLRYGADFRRSRLVILVLSLLISILPQNFFKVLIKFYAKFDGFYKQCQW